MKRIKEWDPEARLVLACRPGLGEFFLETGLADEVIHVDKKNKDAASKALAELRSREWDTVIAPHESVRTALMMWRLKARQKVSFWQWWNGFVYGKRVEKPKGFPDALRQLSLLTPLDSRLAEMFAQDEVQQLRNVSDKSDLVDYREPTIPEWASMKIMGLTPQGHRIFMAPGSTWNTKRWTARGYTELAKLLHARGAEVILVGSKAERDLCEEIASAAPGVVNRAGETSLKDLVQLLRTGKALITNDSGSMHAAAVSGLPTVAVFGPTTLDLGFRPWNNQAVVVQRNLDCRPCGKHGHDHCPLGHHHCMEKIEALQVLKALDHLFGENF